jgi:hypothetical protein
MKFIDYMKVIAQLNDAEIIMLALLKRQSLQSLDREYYLLAVERIKLNKKHFDSLLSKEHHWATAKNDRNKVVVLNWELSNNLVVTQLILESQALLEGLRKSEAFCNIFKNFARMRELFIELLVTEHQFISDYQQISIDKPHLSKAIDKYCSQKIPTLIYSSANATNSKKLLTAYDKAKNCLAITYEELFRFANNILYGVEWLDNKIFATTDFICFYEYQLRSWVLSYSSLSELFSNIKLAAQEQRIELNAEEHAAINHVTNRLIGSVQRLGRYKLLLEQIAATVKSIIEINVLPIPAIARTPPIVMTHIMNLILAKNKVIERIIGAVNYPCYLIENLTELIKRLNDFVNDLKERNQGSLSFFSTIAPLEQGQIDCANSLIPELNELLRRFNQELNRYKQTKQNQNTFDLTEFDLFDKYSSKTRDTIRVKFRQFENTFRGIEYLQLSKLPFYQLLDNYCQKIQPLSSEDKRLISEQNDKVRFS